MPRPRTEAGARGGRPPPRSSLNSSRPGNKYSCGTRTAALRRQSLLSRRGMRRLSNGQQRPRRPRQPRPWPLASVPSTTKVPLLLSSEQVTRARVSPGFTALKMPRPIRVGSGNSSAFDAWKAILTGRRMQTATHFCFASKKSGGRFPASWRHCGSGITTRL